jgi:hypothetical protein
VDTLWQPDCSDDSNPGIPESRSGDDLTPEDYEERAELHEKRAGELRQSGDPRDETIAEFYERLAGYAREVSESVQEYERVLDEAAQEFEATGDLSTETKERLRSAEHRALVAAGAYDPDVVDQRIEEIETQLRRAREGQGQYPDPSDPLGSDLQDPRCAGRKTQAAQGTLFTNKQFCGESDMITCLRRASDSVFAFTGGVCRTETGPEDSALLVCTKQEQPGAEASEGPGGADAGPVDAPLSFRLPGSERIEQDFIEMTPLGGIIINLCMADGPLCGSDR